MYVRSGFAYALVVTTLAVVFVATVAFAEEEKIAPKGSRTATQEDLEWMKWSGIPDPKVGMAINPDDPNIGKAAGEVKQWLAQHASKNANIICLNPQFAQKLKTFMEAVPGGIPTITDGYRSPNKQPALVASGASKAGPCQSYHNYGQAADFNGGGNIPWMRANANRYGIGVIGSWDPGHFQDGAGRTGQCGACSNDSGNGTLPPPSGSPSSNFANAIRQALGMQQQPQQQPQLPPQPLQQAQPIFNAFEMPAQITTPTSSDMTTGSTTSSIADKLEQLAKEQEQSPATTTTATSVPIYIDSSDRGGVQSTQQPQATASTTGVSAITQNTFVTQDLSYQQPAITTAYGPILTSLRAALVRILQALVPFGGQTVPQSNVTGEAYLE